MSHRPAFRPEHDPSDGRQYEQINPLKIARIEIFPPVGIARVGDSGSNDVGEPDSTREVEYFYGPEVPGVADPPVKYFRDSEGKIKRQAVRFRVYAYDENGKVLGEVNNAQHYQLKWTVHVANKKAAFYCFRGLLRAPNTNLRNPDIQPIPPAELNGDPFDQNLERRTKLIIDSGEQSIERELSTGCAAPVPLAGQFQGSLPDGEPITVTLGELRTDDKGRLVFIGGSGVARSVQGPNASVELSQPEIISEFDSTDWIDSVCDGWVDVEVRHKSDPSLARRLPRPNKATVVSAPPKFAWGIGAQTTLYDIFENIYKGRMSYVDHKGTDFYKDIWPVLASTYGMSWVNDKAFQGHGPRGYANFLLHEHDLSNPEGDSEPRQHIFGRLREPDYTNKDQAHVILMPRLSGDNGDALEPGTIRSITGDAITRFAALTKLQYNRFKDWKDGNFSIGKPFGKKKAIEDYDNAEQPVLLTRAMLEQTIGDPLYPGIETYWIVKEPTQTMYLFNKDLKGLHPPFRVNHGSVLPGFLTRGLSLPWQSDSDLCNTHWWPSARPDNVFVPYGAEDANAAAHASHMTGASGAVPVLPRTLQSITKDGPDFPFPRKNWTRGLRVTPEDVTTSFYPGSTDMVQHWLDLGFVKLMKDTSNVHLDKGSVRGDSPRLNPPSGEVLGPVWVEEERNIINGFR